MQEDMSDDPQIPRSVLETYCFISTTFTVSSFWQASNYEIC